MTIKPGEAWGVAVPAPEGLVAVTDDAALAQHLTASRDGDTSVAPALVAGGDLRRTLGGTARSSTRPGTVNALPIDLVEVVLDDGPPQVACAHVVLRSPWWRGGWLRGPIVLVMNAEFIGEWDVAPRGHPNDGRVEVVEAGGLRLRERVAARRRLPTAAHVPHPRIVTRSVRSARWTFAAPVEVRLDGVAAGTARTVAITVLPDAAVVHA